MKRHLENLRDQHPSVRARVSFLAALTVTSIVVFVWFTTLPFRFGGGEVAGGDGTSNTAAVLNAAGEVLTPELESIQSSFDSIRNSYSSGSSGETVAPQEVVHQDDGTGITDADMTDSGYPADTAY